MTASNERFGAGRAQKNQKNLKDYIVIVLRHWKIFTVCFLSVFLGVMLYTFHLPRIYEATTTFRVGEDKSASAMPWALAMNASSPVDADIEMLKSRSYAERVARLLQLDIRMAPRIRAGMRPREIGRTGIISLSYRDTSPRLARNVANAMVQVFTEQEVALKSQEAVHTMEFISDQLKKVRKDMEESEDRLQAYKASSGRYSLDLGATKTIDALAGIEDKKAEIMLLRKRIEFSIASLAAAIREGKPFYPSNPGEATMAEKLSELISRLAALKEEYTEDHPQVRYTEGQIEWTRQTMLGFYDAKLRDLERQEAFESGLERKYESELRKLPVAERQIATRLRRAKMNTDLYILLQQKYEQMRLAKAATVSNVYVIDSALVPDAPVAPNRFKNTVLGLWGGLLSGVGLALFLDYLDDTIKDEELAKSALELPILATVPHMPLKKGGDDGISLCTYLEPKSVSSEAFRNLRTNIHFSAINKKRQVLMLTSSFQGEGKSTVISNLAVVLSQTGARVLLLECDLRRPSISKKFGLDKSPGITEILAGDADIDGMIHNTGIQGLDIISAGEIIPPNPSELLGSDAMKRLVMSFRERYDNILIDAPPVLSVADPAILATISDMAIVVLELGRVTLKAARGMREMLDHVEAPVAGLVVNDRTGKIRRYGYYGYRYGYEYGYSEDGNRGKGWLKRLLKLDRRNL